jgi:hypothetical protein
VHWCGLQFAWVRCLSERERSRDVGGVGAGQDVLEGLGRAQKYVIFIAAYLYGFHSCAPFDLMTNKPSVERPNLYEFNAPNAKQFIKDISSIRLDIKDALKFAQSCFENSYNKNHIPITFEPGDQVLINIHLLELPELKGKGSKFARQFNRPFKVTEHVTPVAYCIQLPHPYGIHPVLSITHLKPYISDNNLKERIY